ncbi:MAG: lyase family protein [Candidatus Woesearchaeota archaeon]
MELYKLFTKRNLEILNILMKENLHIRDIAARLGCSPAKVHNTIQLFKKNNLINEKKEKNKIIISLNKDNKVLKEINTLIGINDNFIPAEEDETIELFDTINPLDFRYYGRSKSVFNKLQPYLSESGMINYMLKVEAALTKTLAKKGICSKKIADEVQSACNRVTAEQVYREEDRIKHNVRALANCIRKNVSDEAKPFVHFTTTSHDIICTADALRYKEFTNKVLIPELINFENTLINLAFREKNTLQIGRTHGQHAEPITFGFTIAQYVSRLGHRILQIKEKGNDLRGKIAGAVGAYNASNLFFDDPVKFEEEVLKELNLKPSPISTQIVEAEYITDYVNSVISCFGVLANLADDMRHLQRSEIGEVGEFFEAKQVGSSTMPQKRNPINFENVKSMWKAMMPRMITVYSDQISEHQRDLTNSASSRFIPDILASLYVSIVRLNKIMSNLQVDKSNMKRNFDMNKDLIVAEPLYILLAAHNHPDAHEHVRELTLKSQLSKKTLKELIKKDQSLKEYLKKFNKKQLDILNNPEKYTGIASKKTEDICSFWKKNLT